MIKANVKTTVKGGAVKAKLEAALKAAQGAFVTVGVHADAGRYKEPKSGSAPTVGQVAWWQEFGTEDIPARPFIRPAEQDNRALLGKWRAEGLANIVNKGWPVSKALAMIGFRFQILVQNKIRAYGPAADTKNSSYDPPKGYLGWKKRQGMPNRQLVATGLLLRSINYEVHDNSGTITEKGAAIGEVKEPQEMAALLQEKTVSGKVARSVKRETSREMPHAQKSSSGGKASRTGAKKAGAKHAGAKHGKR